VSVSTDPYDILSYLVILIGGTTTLGVIWMWGLYLGKDNPKPRSRLLFVLAYVGTLINLAEIPLAWLAARRLQDAPTLGIIGGIILVGVILTLTMAYLLIIGYLFWLRRVRPRDQDGRRRPPPFSEAD